MADEVTVKDHPNKFANLWDDDLWRLETVPQNIYVAASLGSQCAAARLALRLQDAGFLVTSRWLRTDLSNRPDKSDNKRYIEYQKKWAQVDLQDLEEADTLVLLAHGASTSGGYHVELGYFLGTGKNIVVVGNRPNCFYFASCIRYANDEDGLIDWLLAQSAPSPGPLCTEMPAPLSV